MFAYNPQVNDRSGEIYGAHQVQAAQATAAGQMSLGKSIGDGVKDLAGSITTAYMNNKTLDAQGKAGKDLLKIMAPAAGMDPTTEDFKNLMKLSNHEFAAMSPEIFKVMPSMVASNSYTKLFTTAGLKAISAQPTENQRPFAPQSNAPQAANPFSLVPNRPTN